MAVGTGIALIFSVTSLVGYTAFRTSAAVRLQRRIGRSGRDPLDAVDTMIPEPFESTHDFAGLITVIGFLIAFVLAKMRVSEDTSTDRVQGHGCRIHWH